MSPRTPSSQQARIDGLLTPVVTAAGYDVEKISVAAAGRRSLVRVVVDKDGGVSLDDVAAVTRLVSDALDDADGDLGGGPYTLEVTSPGVDRPLTEPRHWRRAVGRLVTVAVGDHSLEGRVLDADDATVRLDVGGSVHELDYVRLGQGRVQVEFGRKEGA
jgi:ribosome maturation factor RimP